LRVAALAAGGAILALHLGQVLHLSFAVDDAFIAYRYVENWVGGEGLVYNPGERVEGYTSFLWLALVAAMRVLGVPSEAAGFAWGLGASVATLAGVYLAATRLFGLRRGVALAACALLAATGPFTFWAGAGLEAPLFAALLLAVFAGTASDLPLRASGPAWLFAVAALCALTRPEGLALFPALLAGLLWERRARARHVLLGALAFVAFVGGHLAFRVAYYGEWLPNTAFAKVGLSGAMIARGLGYLWDYLGGAGIPYLAALAVLPFLAWRRRGAAISLGLLLAGYVGFIVLVGGDGLYAHRFIAHVAPLLALAAGIALDALARLRRGPVLAAIAGIAAVAVLAVPLLQNRLDFGRSAAALEEHERRWEDVGHALKRHAPPDLTVATNVAGKLPFHAGKKTLDLLGLCDKTIARTPTVDEGRGYAGHERAAPEYVLARSPDVIYLSVLDGAPPALFADRARVAAYLERTALWRWAPLLRLAGFDDRYRPAYLATGAFASNVLVRPEVAGRFPADVLRVYSWRSASAPAKISQ
jgi:hypothetical protein